MSAIYVVHWDAEQVPGYASAVSQLGYDRVTAHSGDAAVIRSAACADVPALVVVWLSREPAQGRELGLSLTAQEATRRIPLLFVDGAAAAVADTRAALPQAHFTTSMLLPGELVRLLGHE